MIQKKEGDEFEVETKKKSDSDRKQNDPYGKKKIEFLEHVNEIELIAGIVGITVALVYQGIWVAIAVAIGVIFLESIILVEISTAKNVAKIRKQNEGIERALISLHASLQQKTHEEVLTDLQMLPDEEEEENDPYKWYKIAGWSALFIALTFLINHFFDS